MIVSKVVVQKYGGSSVSSTEKIKLIASKLIERKKKNPKIVVVVSAMGDTTDDFISMAKDITKSPDKRELDVLMSTGEMISASLLSMSLNSLGCEAVSYNAYQLNIKTSGLHGKSLIDDIDVSKINESLDSGKIVIVTGFQGLNDEGDITTLGRGGSDTSAVALAVKLDGICEIYTDVDGIYFTDPRKYSEAKKIKEIEYEEMLELASLGAQVMHSRSVELAQKYDVELYVGLSCSDIEGTYIRGSKEMKLEDKVITGLATCDDDAAITIVDIKMEDVSKLFEKIAVGGVSVDMISQTAPFNKKVNVSFTIPKDDLRECKEIVGCFVPSENIIIDEGITKFSLVGLGMKNTSGVASKVFKIFSDNNIAVKLITTSEIRITCAINSSSKEVAIREIAKEFNL
ncbi:MULTISPECIES: aspartate kinase [Terrisporobacter]|mgnify:CR=1 FL=1|uniref:Aspartokinase n=2 Tax=Terrisporobacter TaxID=1505652 RepID=A0A0B3WRJ4_9FIRM|nr:aspartate kinase [Terrisporobacter muris]KHS57165.1 aspartate kinase [Terrisporobacter othiniensis]MCR1823861.1 aspartate kinase [Terrisporobacter muris]